jgi:hypothetical protein
MERLLLKSEYREEDMDVCTSMGERVRARARKSRSCTLLSVRGTGFWLLRYILVLKKHRQRISNFILQVFLLFMENCPVGNFLSCTRWHLLSPWDLSLAGRWLLLVCHENTGSFCVNFFCSGQPVHMHYSGNDWIGVRFLLQLLRETISCWLSCQKNTPRRYWKNK